MLSDPDSDLKGWIAALDRLDTLGAQGLVPTHLNPTPAGAPEIERTRSYLTSMLAFLVEQKKQNAPEARVSGELVAEQLARLLPARAERDQRALGLPPASERRDDPAGGCRRESRGEVTPGAPAAPVSARGKRASTVVWRPPRGVKAPRTAIRRG